jgi:hypothetical protein
MRNLAMCFEWEQTASTRRIAANIAKQSELRH